MTRTTRLATPGPKSNRSPTYCPMRGVVLRDDTNQLVPHVDDLLRRLAAERLHDRFAPKRHSADFVIRVARSDLKTISYRGDSKRKTYHDEHAHVSSVSVSRSPGPPHFGHVVLTNSGTLASGDFPVPGG